MRIILILTLSIIFLTNCKKSKTVYEYYGTGEIKSKIFYPDKNDTLSFRIIRYYKNKNIQLRTQFISGKRDGNYEMYYNNGNIKIQETFKNGVPDGIMREYTINGIPSEERFYIRGKLILIKKYFINEQANILKIEPYLFDKDSLLHQLGIIIYDEKKNEIIEDASFYYNVIGPDTIQIERNTKYLVKFLNKRDDFDFELYIGNLSPELMLLDTSFYNVTSADTIYYPFISDKPGGNLITGMIYLRKDTIILKFPFYKEIFVKN